MNSQIINNKIKVKETNKEKYERNDVVTSKLKSNDAEKTSTKIENSNTNTIENLKAPIDAFAECGLGGEKNQFKIHIYCKNRSSRTKVTSIQGLQMNESCDIEKLSKSLRKKFHCTSSIKFDKEHGDKVIMLSGDQKLTTARYLVDKGLFTWDQITIHGA
jgi:translation initiation factor SUI1